MSDWAALASLYGAIAGLGELGPEVIKSCLLPYICLLGERLKAASESGGANNVDKVILHLLVIYSFFFFQREFVTLFGISSKKAVLIMQHSL